MDSQHSDVRRRRADLHRPERRRHDPGRGEGWRKGLVRILHLTPPTPQDPEGAVRPSGLGTHRLPAEALRLPATTAALTALVTDLTWPGAVMTTMGLGLQGRTTAWVLLGADLVTLGAAAALTTRTRPVVVRPLLVACLLALALRLGLVVGGDVARLGAAPGAGMSADLLVLGAGAAAAAGLLVVRPVAGPPGGIGTPAPCPDDRPEPPPALRLACLLLPWCAGLLATLAATPSGQGGHGWQGWQGGHGAEDVTATALVLAGWAVLAVTLRLTRRGATSPAVATGARVATALTAAAVVPVLVVDGCLRSGLPWWIRVISGIGALATLAAAPGPRPGTAPVVEDWLVIDLRDRRYTSETVTTTLCRAAHLSPALTRAVRRGPLAAGRTWGPTPGVDVARTARHLLLAGHRQRVRDAVVGAACACAAAWGIAGRPGPAAFFVIAATVAAGTERVVARHTAARVDAPAPLLTGAEEAQVKALCEQERGTVVDYLDPGPGDGTPYLGSGRRVARWAIALGTLWGDPAAAHPADPQGPLPTDDAGGERSAAGPVGVPPGVPPGVLPGVLPGVPGEAEVLLAIERKILTAGLPDAHVEERHYRCVGHAPRGIARLLPGAGGYGPTTVEDRSRRCVRIPGWGGEFVLTVMIDVRIAGGLHLEVEHLLLAPPRRRWSHAVPGRAHDVPGRAYDVPGLRPTTRAGRVVPVGCAAASGVVGALVLGVPALVGELLVRPGRGTRAGVRELAAGRGQVSAFAAQDQAMMMRVVDRAVLEAVGDLLVSRGLDITELWERQTAVLDGQILAQLGAGAPARRGLRRHP